MTSLTKTFKYLCNNCSISLKSLLPLTQVESFLWKVIDWLETEMSESDQLQVTYLLELTVVDK